MSLRQRFSHSVLTEWEAKQLLREHDIPVVEEDLATDADEAVEIAEYIGFPVMLKVVARGVEHKTEAGGVKKASNPKEVRERYREIVKSVSSHKPDAEIDGILVEEQVDGNEFIVGTNTDPQFGKVLMFGLGGIYVEVFQDVSFRLIPVNKADIESMIHDLESKSLLEGVRGQQPVDTDQLADVLLKVSQLVDNHPEIEELDINPLFVKHGTIKAADALIKLEE